MQKVTRLEVIDEKGRAYVRHNVAVYAQEQDDGKTLKVFVTGRHLNDGPQREE